MTEYIHANKDGSVSIAVEDIIGNTRTIVGYITDIEDDAIHIRTLDGENKCIGL